MIGKLNYKRLLLLATLPAFMLASCTQEEMGDSPDTQNGEIRFEMGFAPMDVPTQTDPQTRVATDTDFKSTWEEGDEIGIFAVEHGGKLADSDNLFHNVKLTYSSANGGKWTAAEPMYWPTDGTKLDFYAYYPYNETISNLELPINLPEDQSVMTDKGQPVYNRNDVLWGKNINGIGKNDGTVSLPFSHMLAMVQVKVSSSMLGNYAPDALDVWLVGAVIRGNSLHISNAEFIPNGSMPEDANTLIRTRMYPCPTDDGKGTYAYRALVMPVSITAGTNLFRFEYNGTELLTSPPLTTTLRLARGRVETFDMTFPFTSVTVSPTVRIADLIPADKLGAVTHLKVLGEMTEADFTTIKEKMPLITTVDLGGATVVGNAIPDEAFKEKTTLKEFVFPRNITTIGNQAFFFCSGFTGDLVIPDEVTTIGNEAFYFCRGFTGDLVIPDEVTTIGNQAFFFCSGFTGDLVIPDEVTTIGNYAFSGCSGFDGTLTLSKKLTTIGSSAFDGCTGFEGTLTLSNKLTTIGNLAFRGCSKLTGSLVIPDEVTTIGSSAFDGCTGFEGTLTLSKKLTTIGNYAFSGCSGFTGGLVIPNEVTTIGITAFSGCSGFKGTLTLSKKLTTIGNYAFSGCSGFTGGLVIPNEVTTIGDYAFNGCRGFNGSMTIPQSVTTIGDYAFANCSGLTSITCHIQDPSNVTTGSKPFFKVPNSIPLNVPDGTQDAYKNTSPWSDFNDIRPIL